MIALIDTSSLVSLARYYLPHDKNNALLKYIEQQLEEKKIVVIDRVFDESGYVAKGIVLQKMAFIGNHKVNTVDLLPSQKFFNQLENEFCYGAIKNKLPEAEFEAEKSRYLGTPDPKLVLYWQKHHADYASDNLVVVTEETTSENDKKLFKKLPAICDILQIEHGTLPELMTTFEDLEISFNHLRKKK